jgi:hypothetical protein
MRAEYRGIREAPIAFLLPGGGARLDLSPAKFGEALFVDFYGVF